MTEQLRLEEVLRDGGAIDDHEGSSLAGAVEVDGPGEQLFPGAALALQQHRRVRPRNPRRNFDRILHTARFRDHAREGEALRNCLAEVPVFAPERGEVERLAQRDAKLFARERLGQVVGRSAFYRFDRRADRAVRRQHQDRQIRLDRLETGKQLHAVAARHLHVGHDQVDRLDLELLQR